MIFHAFFFFNAKESALLVSKMLFVGLEGEAENFRQVSVTS